MDSPLVELQRLGQSPWHDNIHRGLLARGALARMVRDGDITGLTSNPTIFEHAIATTPDYDDALAELVAAGRKPDAIVDALVLDDIQQAADVFRPVFDRTQRADGYVSIEVSPALAHDSDGTIREAKRLWRAVNRPNLMVKIPATLEGLPAITEAIAAGINVNVTLIFSIARYRQVMDAYLAGLERRQEQGMRIDRLASVASFFVSRVDTAVDKLLDAKIATVPVEQRPKLERLKGRAAIAQAKLAYATFREVFGSDRFARLARDGAHVQRPLWASTSTKNPAYPDVYYVDALVGPDTVDTMPPQTIAAYKDHGHPEPRLEQNLDIAKKVLADLEYLGIRMDDVTAKLEQEGVASFAASWNELLDVVGKRREAIRVASRMRLQLGGAEKAVQRALATLTSDKVTERLWKKDATLWPGAPAARAEIAQRFGWLDLPTTMRAEIDGLREFADDARRAGFTHALLVGMGGSSLAPATLRKTLGVARGSLDLAVLDSTDPAALQAAWKRSDPSRTLYLVASKSGGTIEVDALFRILWARVHDAVGERAREHFVAITDPGTSLAREAAQRGFRRVFLNPPDIGGRYSALSLFGLVPAALMGHDLAKLLDRAGRMAVACGPTVPPRHNPGVHLGAILGAVARAGRDKLTLVVPARLASFADWIEQLVAESSGKDGRGIVPIVGEPLGTPAVYGDDRCVVHLRLGAKEDRAVAALARAGHPVVTIDLADAWDVAGEFVRWEIAIAVACRILEVNPFDQPNVQEAKAATARMLESIGAEGVLPAPSKVLDPEAADFATRLASHLAAARGRRWVAFTAFLAPTPKRDALVGELRTAVRKRFGVATMAGYGPRYLHSTGQLLKGGPATAIVVQLTADAGADVDVPGKPWTLGTLEAAQAVGDLDAMAAHRRPAVRVHLGARIDQALAAVLTALQKRVVAKPAARAAKTPGRKRPAARARAAGRR